MLALPLIFIGLILSLSSPLSLALSAGMAMTGPLVYYTLDVAKERKWCRFEDRFTFSEFPSYSSSLELKAMAAEGGAREEGRPQRVPPQHSSGAKAINSSQNSLEVDGSLS